MGQSITKHGYVVDDDSLLRKTLVSMLNSIGYCSESYSSGGEFLEDLENLVPGMVLMDVRMPGIGGLETLSKLLETKPDFMVVMISGTGDIPVAVKAMQIGALDFIEKPIRLSDLKDTLFQAEERAINILSETRSEFDPLNPLTDRELQVVKLLVAGMQNKVVARELGISPRTVEVHRSRIMQKLETTTFAELVRLAVKSPQISH